MKRILTFLFVLCFVPLFQAQWVYQNFDNAVGTFFPDPSVLNSNFYTNGPTAFMNLANDPEHIEGTGSTKINYRVEAYDGWGGYNVRTTYTPETIAAMPYIDFSTGTDLKLKYKVITPATVSQAGETFIEFKMAEYDDDGKRDLWLHHSAIDLSDPSGTWKEATIPLKLDANNTLGFTLQFGDGDNELQLHNIKAFEIAIVYITGGSSVNPPTSTGTVLFDKLELVGNRYNPFQTFDNAAANVFSVDFMSWAGAGASSAALSNNTTDFVEGTASMQLDYTVNASQSWGGYLNMTDTTFRLPSDFAERTGLVLYVKNANPIVGKTPKRVTMRFFLMEKSTGVNEDWVIEVPIDLETAGEWTRYYLPLKMDTVWTDPAGQKRFPQNGFSQPWWSITGDNTFNLESVTGYKLELSAGDNTYGAVGETFTGTLLFDVLQQSGFQFADNEPPAAPGNIFVVADQFTNLVTWEDNPGETGEKYYVYASPNPITDVTAKGVELIASNVLGGIQVVDHLLRAPITNQEVTFYYAITCKDFAGNLGPAGISSSVTNVGRGVPVVSQVTPAFVADGNLSEWSSIAPFVIKSSDGTGTIQTGFTITNDADCSAEAYISIDSDNLYVAFKVNDDILVPTGTFASYELDAPDLFIGLYDSNLGTHSTYLRGSTPDYQLRFNKTSVRNDDYTSELDSLLIEGPNYYYGELFPTGYVIEAKIPLVDLATLRKRPDAAIDTIKIKKGDKIPIDFGINDNDGTSREGLLFYSPRNNDQGHNNPSLWTYTWLTDWVTGIEDQPGVVNKFSLSQNYPNPFNPTTQISYSIANAGLVKIRVFDLLGSEVAELVNSEQAAGVYTINFNASMLSSGVYFYKIESGSYAEAKKMILMK